jgi:uncharacterized membrane protein
VIEHPVGVFAALAAACGLIFLLAAAPRLQPLFRYVPAVILVVFLPAGLSGFGLLPRESAAYDALRDYGLPLGLLLMVATTDIRSVLRVGPRALAMFLCGSAGVLVGAVLVFTVFHSHLPQDSWKMFAAISASWIGGGVNFAAVQSAVGMPGSLIGPAIVVDASVTYLWLAVTLAAVSYQHVVTRFYAPLVPVLEASAAGEPADAATARELDYADLLVVVGVGLAAAAASMAAGRWVWDAIGPGPGSTSGLALVLSEYMVGIVVVTVVGVALSLTPVRRLDRRGALPVAYAAQFLFFASLGAQADFSAILAMPLLVLAGVAWITCHAVGMAVGARLLRAPMSLIAVCSSANIGGSSTAAVIGAQYGRSWSSLGILLGLFGNLIGTFAGLLCGLVLAAIAS